VYARSWLLIGFVAAVLACAPPGDPDPAGGAIDLPSLDAVFSEFADPAGPGCAMAVSRDGQEVLSRAYGMADLEWRIPNVPETVFEPGSVSKQFTAAATMLLVIDGAISLDDDIRDYFPEIPDYGEPVTVRMLVNHTSGLRDWGSIAGIEGWRRWTRVHSHKHALDIVTRQQALNYEPGRYWSYTNSGYNLLAMLVERVTGMSFDGFSQERLFGPLGMTNTEWRDDFTEVVENRAVGYSPGDDGEWHMDMPFENVTGNGGLLTTVGDMLRFARNLDTGEVGGGEFIRLMHEQGILDSGRQLAYAGGIYVEEYRGLKEVHHSGGTAGYRGYLTRFPDHGVAISIMCNDANASPRRLAHGVADLYLADAITQDESGAAPATVELEPELLAPLAGTYRDTRTGQPVEIATDGDHLSFGGDRLFASSSSEFSSASGIEISFETVPMADGRPAALMDSPVGDDVRLEPVADFEPTARELADYVGSYYSHEAEATYSIAADGGTLTIANRYGEGPPGNAIRPLGPDRTLTPAYRDVFTRGLTTYIFRRDQAGRITGLSLSEARVWDLRFERTR